MGKTYLSSPGPLALVVSATSHGLSARSPGAAKNHTAQRLRAREPRMDRPSASRLRRWTSNRATRVDCWPKSRINPAEAVVIWKGQAPATEDRKAGPRSSPTEGPGPTVGRLHPRRAGSPACCTGAAES